MKRASIACVGAAIATLYALVPVCAQDRSERIQSVLINDLAASHPASAYLDQSTLMVGEIAWSKIDINEFFSLVQNATGDRPTEIGKVKELFAKLQNANAGNIYVIAGLQTLSDGAPLVMIPTPEPTQLFESIRDDFGNNVRVSPNGTSLLFGEPSQLKRYDSFTPAPRDEILTPLRDANRLEHTAVIVIPELTRKMLSNLWPQQNPIGIPVSASPSQLALDVKRMVVTLRTPPNPRMRLTIEAVDATAADRITKTFADLKQHVGQLLDHVTIQRVKQQIILEADSDAIEQFQTVAANARRQASRSQLVSTMKQLGIAIHVYADREKHLPPRCFVDPNGTPLHSWLVAVLPDFNQLAFYRSIRLDKSWDDAANNRLKITTPAGIGNQALPVAHTTIRAPVFPGSLWHGNGPPKKMKQITDNLSQTILLADAPTEDSIHWADPTPWVISESDPIKDFFGQRDRVTILMCDGAVMILQRAEMTNEKLKAMLTIAGDD